MKYLERRMELRFDPSRLVPGSCRAIVARMDYQPPDTQPLQILEQPDLGYVSRYALGRDYHKVVRGRLRALARRINERSGRVQLRAFTDSAPILEKALAEKAGLGWIGKHTLLLNRSAGSWFFLGEVLTDLPLPVDSPALEDHCGRCRACITVCPTAAITGPRQLDARRCISYLTIEYKGAIPLELRALIGNRIFGCDDCQLVCPWNRFAQASAEAGLSTASRTRSNAVARPVRLVGSRNFWRALKAARCAGSTTSSGNAMSRWHSATRRRSARRCRTAAAP